MKFEIASLILFLLMVSGCGPAPQVNSFLADRKDPTDQQINAAKNGNLYCEFKGECEPSVALVSVATAEGLTRCSGFLISDHEVLTNDHCLTSIPDREDACQGILFVHFNHDTHRGCKRISVRSHQTGIDSKDYALIELSAPVRDRNPLKISKRGFFNNENATVYSVQATQNQQTHSFDGKQVKLNCHASYSTLMDININSSAESVMTFGDCAIQEGNSGSPIINSSGEAGAVVQGFLNVKNDDFSELIKPYLLDGGYGEMGIASQTRCMLEIVGSVAKSCNDVKPLSALYPKQYMESFGAFSEKLLPKVSKELTWKSVKTQKESVKTYVTSPSCVSSSEMRSGFFSFTSNVMSYRQGINSRLQAEWRPIYSDGEKETLFEVKKSESSSSTNAVFLSSEFGLITIPVCH